MSGVPQQSRKDILNSLLLAQLGANFKVPDIENVLLWYHSFIDILAKIGWIIDGSDVQSFEVKDNLFEVESVIIDILTAAFGASYIVVIKKTLDAIKKLANSDRKIKAFERSTTNVSKGGFQVALVTEQDGLVSLKIGTFVLQSNNDIITVLFFKSNKQQTKLDYISNQATLNTQIYEYNRDIVIEKLGNFVRTNIAEINLS